MNPYSPPHSPGDPSPVSSLNTFRELVLSWERLRLLYNLILLVPGLGILFLAFAQGIPLLSLPVGAILTGIGANLCFCLAPLTELYFRAIFPRFASLPLFRKCLLGAGIAVSLAIFGLVALTLASF